VEEAGMIELASKEAQAICRYLQEERGWELAPGNEIDILLAVAHAHRRPGQREEP
jgi:hypothetical protein